jgi:hypothetical protein
MSAGQLDPCSLTPDSCPLTPDFISPRQEGHERHERVSQRYCRREPAIQGWKMPDTGARRGVLFFRHFDLVAVAQPEIGARVIGRGVAFINDKLVCVAAIGIGAFDFDSG